MTLPRFASEAVRFEPRAGYAVPLAPSWVPHAYDEDQPRDDDGKFGEGGGGGGGKGDDGEKDSDDGPQEGHDPERLAKATRHAAKMEAKYDKYKAQADELRPKSEEASEKSEEAQEVSDREHRAYEEELRNLKEPAEDDSLTDEQVEAAERHHEVIRDRLEKLADKADRLASKASRLGEKLSSAEAYQNWYASKSNDADEHVEYAKLPERQYGAKVLARAREAAKQAAEANQVVSTQGIYRRIDDVAAANIATESKETWEAWRDEWIEKVDDDTYFKARKDSFASSRQARTLGLSAAPHPPAVARSNEDEEDE